MAWYRRTRRRRYARPWDGLATAHVCQLGVGDVVLDTLRARTDGSLVTRVAMSPRRNLRSTSQLVDAERLPEK